MALTEIPTDKLKSAIGTELECRKLSPPHVDELAASLMMEEELTSSTLSAVYYENSFIVIDGNHRLTAIQRIRQTNNAKYRTLMVWVYHQINPFQARMIALSENSKCINVKRMTPDEENLVLRHVLKADPLPDPSDKRKRERRLAILYEMFQNFDAYKTMTEQMKISAEIHLRARIQAHIFVATIEDEKLYQGVQKYLNPDVGAKKVISITSFNNAKSMPPQEQLERLQKFADTGHKSFLRVSIQCEFRNYI